MIIIDATAAKVAHQLVPHQRSGIHVLTQCVIGDCGLQESLALAAHLILVEGRKTAGHNLCHEQQYQQGAVLQRDGGERDRLVLSFDCVCGLQQVEQLLSLIAHTPRDPI